MTITELANITGFCRQAIKTRVVRFELGKNWRPKDLLDLKPLDDAHKITKSLEEARTELAIEDTRLKRLAAEKLEGQLADVAEIEEVTNELFESIAAVIKSSELSDEKKEDIFTAIQDLGKTWRVSK